MSPRALIILLILLASCAGPVTPPVPPASPTSSPSVTSVSPTAASVAPSPTVDLSTSLDCVRQVLDNDICYAGKSLASDPGLLEAAARSYCDSKGPASGGFCCILIWKERVKMPASFPMGEANIMAQIAQYDRDPAAGIDCFTLLKNDQVLYKSPGCGD